MNPEKGYTSSHNKILAGPSYNTAEVNQVYMEPWYSDWYDKTKRTVSVSLVIINPT
jgi:hypothetical protein